MSLIDFVIGERQLRMAGENMVPAVMTGIVRDLEDPLFLSRVRVLVPAIDASDPLPWARVAQPAASMASGMYWMPNENDEVLVAFENGDMNAPYVIGCLWSAVNVPPAPSPLLGIRVLRTPGGNQILISEDPATITISTPTLEQMVTMTPAGIQIIAGANVINMTKDGISIAGANVNIVATGQVAINAPTVSVIGTAATTVGAGASPTTVAGKPISIA